SLRSNQLRSFFLSRLVSRIHATQGYSEQSRSLSSRSGLHFATTSWISFLKPSGVSAGRAFCGNGMRLASGSLLAGAARAAHARTDASKSSMRRRSPSSLHATLTGAAGWEALAVVELYVRLREVSFTADVCSMTGARRWLRAARYPAPKA